MADNRSPFGIPRQPKGGMSLTDKSSPWWHFQPSWILDPDEALVQAGFIRRLETGQGTMHCIYAKALTRDPSDLIVARYGHPTHLYEDSINMPITKVWVWPSGLLVAKALWREPIASMGSFNPADIEWFRTTLSPLQSVGGTCNSIYVVSRSSPVQPLELRKMGYITSPLERDNYDPQVLVQYDAALRDLRRPHPNGRILLLEGPPGGGKTFLLRGLITEVSATYVVVSPKHYEDLMEAEFLTSLQDNLPQGEDGPMVLVLEDADKLLAPRAKGTSLSGLSSALNMGDGLLSDLLDIRILATTNAGMKSLDPAILRPGRLSGRIHIGSLTPAHAAQIFQRLCPDSAPMTFPEGTILADVYQVAKDHGWEAPPVSRKCGMSLKGGSPAGRSRKVRGHHGKIPLGPMICKTK